MHTMNNKILSEDSISKITKQSFPSLKINKSGRELLAELMNKINSSLIGNFDKEYENIKGTNGSVLKCVRKAVTKTLPVDFRCLALGEGQRQVALYETGHLVYDHTRCFEELKASQKSAKKPKSAKVQPIHSKFITAVSKVNTLFSSKYKNVKIGSKAKEVLGIYLYQLTKKIALTAAETVSQNSSLHNNHIDAILPEFLAGQVLTLARGEGIRNIILHVQGIKEFKPKKIKALPEDFDGDLDVKREADVLISLPSAAFKKGIRKLLADINASVKIDESLHQILSVLLNCILSKVNDLANEQNLEEIDYTQVSTTVMELFPTRLFDHGAFTAYRMVKDYIEGNIIYKKRKIPSAAAKPSSSKKRKVSPKSAGKKSVRSKSTRRKRQISGKSATRKRSRSRTKRSEEKYKTTKKAKKEKKMDFSKKILDIFVDAFASQSTFSAAIGRGGIEKLNSCLVDICKSLVVDCGNESCVSVETVKAAVAKHFPDGEIAKHAIGAAAKVLTLSKSQSDGNIRVEQIGAKKISQTKEKSDFQEAKASQESSENYAEAPESQEEDEMDATEAPDNEVDASEDQQDEPTDATVKQEITQGASAETVPISEPKEPTE